MVADGAGDAGGQTGEKWRTCKATYSNIDRIEIIYHFEIEIKTIFLLLCF